MSDDSWMHLKPYGYAPGDYQIKCLGCGSYPFDCDKRAWRCKPCAEKLHSKMNQHKPVSGQYPLNRTETEEIIIQAAITMLHRIGLTGADADRIYKEKGL